MDPSLEAGTRIGRYVLESLLGAGGMAEVWLVTDEMLSRPVALKIVLPKLLSESEFVARFLREARVAAGLEHPNIPQIFDVGTHEGRPYLVYPLLSGGTLADRLAQPASFAEVIEWLGQLASALDYAHHQSIVHRDVKPANALFDKKGRLYLSDFGLAKSIKEGPGLTLTGVLVGTPAFMSPEQASGGVVGPSADQYSLGIIAYRMLAGRLPFSNPASPIVIHKILNEPLPSACSFRPDLPPAVDRVLGKVLNKRAEARFMSCSEFVRVLAAALDPETTDSVLPDVEPLLPTGEEETPGTASIPVDVSSLETGVAPPRKKKKKKRSEQPPAEAPASEGGVESSPEPHEDHPVAPPLSEARAQKFRVVVQSDTEPVSIFDEPGQREEVTDEVPTLSRPKPVSEKPVPAEKPSPAPRAASAAPIPAPSTAAPRSGPPFWAWIAGGTAVAAIIALIALRSGSKKEPSTSAQVSPTAISAPSTVSGAAPASSVGAPARETAVAEAPARAPAPDFVEIPQPRLIPEGVGLETTTVAVSGEFYMFIFSFDQTVPKPKAKDIRVPSIKVLSRGGKDLVAQTPKPKPYVLELKGATGNVLSFGLKVTATDFKGEHVLMTGDTLRLDWGSQSPFGRASVFALTSARR